MNKYLPKIIGSGLNLISYILPQYAAKLAIKVFSTPRKGKLNDTESDYLKSAKQEQLSCNGLTIKTYYWSGIKETILLVHGWESNAFRWKDLIELLKLENYNIISIDAPAHGDSDGKTFNAVLYSEFIHTTVKKFNVDIIIGHSIGGTASAITYLKYDLVSVKKLISLGSPANLESLVNNYRKMMGFNKRISKAMDHYYIKHFGYLPNFFSAENFAPKIKAKGLIIHDKKDSIISFKDALELKKHYKNAELIKTTGLGHGLKSNEIYQYILSFINQ